MTAQCTGRARPARTPGLPPLGRLLPAMLALLVAAPALAGTPIPYAGEFREKIDATFFEPAPGVPPVGTRVSPDKVVAYREHLEQKLRFLSGHVTDYERIERGKSKKRARKSARNSDSHLALRLALKYLERLHPDADPVDAYDAAAKVLTLDFATRSYTVSLSSIHIPIHLKNLVFDQDVPSRTTRGGVDAEAGNLVDPTDGSFYTREELAELVRAGSDLSELDPPSETLFWREKPVIASVDVVRNYFEGGDPVHEGLMADRIPFDGAVLELEKVHRTQSKPKLDVIYTDPDCLARPDTDPSDCRRRVKLKFGMEVHADPPANALLSALGFNVDISMHLQNVRVNLGDIPMEQVEKEWASYFDRQRLHIYYPLDTVLAPGGAGRGEDEAGEYLVFPRAVAEPKDPAIERVGFFSFSEGIASNAREARSLFIFNAWIANADMKDEENNKVSLRKDEHGDWRLYLTQQDLGHSFGHVIPEKAHAFPWDIVETNWLNRWLGRLRGQIELTYVCLQDNGLEHNTTYADAKWMVRRIAQLSRDQIDTAVRLGHWPDAVARLYVEKLIYRRNQLVEVFGLSDEFPPLPADRHLTTADGAVVDGELVKSRWEGSHMRFGEHWRDLLVPIGRKAMDVGIWALQAGAGAIDRIDPGRIDLPGRVVINPDILLEVDREIALNPEPTSRADQYIVRDSVALGLDVGVGYFGSAEGSWLKRFSLAYPVATRAQGLRGGNRMLSLLMPIDVFRGQLPDRYVLLREDAFAAGVRVSSDDSGELWDTIGGMASFNRVVRFRSVVDRRDEVPLVWVDRPEYWRARARAFIKAAVVEFPVAWGELASGDLEGLAWRLDPERLGASGGDGEAVFDRLIRFDDPSGLSRIQLEPPTRVRSHFDSRGLRWTLFFVSQDYEVRNEVITHEATSGTAQRVELQAARQRGQRWQFIDNGEEQRISVVAYNAAPTLEAIAPENASLTIHYQVDDALAHSDEFDGYYDFLAGIGVLRASVARDFDAADWEVSGEPDGTWVRLLTRADVQYEAGAIERLLAIRPEVFWRRLAEQLGVSPRVVSRVVDEIERRDPRLRRRLPRRAEARAREAIRRSLGVLTLLERARNAADERARLRLLVQALYQANFRYGPTFDPSVVAALHETAGIRTLVADGDVLGRGTIDRASDDELNLPERRFVVGKLGRSEMPPKPRYRFFPGTAIDLYHMLDWMRPQAENN